MPFTSRPAPRPGPARTAQAEHLDLRAGRDERHQHREQHERHLDHHPLGEVERRHPGDPDDGQQDDARTTANAAYQSRGVATTTSMKPTSASSLRWAGARWTALWPWKWSLWPCPAPIAVSAPRRR